MERIVLDSNSLLRSFSKSSKYHSVWEGILSGNISLFVTADILLEYEEKISYFSSPVVAKSVVAQILNAPTTTVINQYMRWNMIVNDPDDNKFVDCAIAANAKCIVTNDKDYNILKNQKNLWPKVDIKTLEEYHKQLQNKPLVGTKRKRK